MLVVIKKQMSKFWEAYGKWRHPKEYWQGKLTHYFKVVDPAKLQFNPTLIEVKKDRIIFGMMKHYGVLSISKTTLENIDTK